MRVVIQKQYLCSVFAGWSTPSEHHSGLIKHVDHPAFAATRDMLEARGYLNVVRTSLNADRVLSPFTLNGYQFKAGDGFPCAAAMEYRITK